MYLRIRHVLLSSRGISRRPLGVQLSSVLEPTSAGESRRGPLVQRVCRRPLQWWLIRRCILKGYAFMGI